MIKINTAAMSPTMLTYYEQPYERTKRCWIDGAGIDDKNRLVVMCSESIFYPAGGGQKGDRGKIVIPETIMTAAKAEGNLLPRALTIADTRKENGFVAQYVKEAVSPELLDTHIVGKETVLAELDWNFRYTQMRLHSAAHLIHLFMEQVLGRQVPNPNLSDIQEARGVNRYEIDSLVTAEQLNEATRLMNEFDAAGHEIRTSPDTDPGRPSWARLWQCENWKIPCGGVHPANTTEIGPIQTNLSAKKSQTTITFSLT
jgi:alanyl-tRNA synthetase